MNTVIHAAVRSDGRFADALKSFPVGSEQRAKDLNRAWLHLAHQLYNHQHSEDTIFRPALVEVGADATLTTDLGANTADPHGAEPGRGRLAWLQDGPDSDARAFLGQQIPKSCW